MPLSKGINYSYTSLIENKIFKLKKGYLLHFNFEYLTFYNILRFFNKNIRLIYIFLTPQNDKNFFFYSFVLQSVYVPKRLL